MMLKPGLQARQTQNLALTPEIRQSISILRMSAAELERHIQIELDQNPVLNAEFKNYSVATPDYQHMLDTTAALQSIGQLLREQISLLSASDPVRNIALFLSEDLTPEGYLSDSPDESAAFLGVDTSLVEAAVTLLQSCEPVGIGARDLSDCLDLQLKNIGEPQQNRVFLLKNMTLFARRDWAALTRISGFDSDELNRLSKLLRSLDPSPAQALVPDLAPSLYPDIKVIARRDGEFSVALIGSTLPDLTLDRDLAQKMERPSVEKSYLKNNVLRARALIKAIEARSKTVLRVAGQIMSHQLLFFSSGPIHMRPLKQLEIARTLKVHPSTVTRAIAGKSLECDFGVFPLNFFFTNSVNSVEGEHSHSAHVVRLKIRSIINEELPNEVLSDERISALLRQSGVDIARRTVAKYRRCLNIPSSSQRRRSKKFL